VVARQAGKVQGCVAVSRLVRAGITGQVRTRLGVRVRVRARARARARVKRATVRVRARVRVGVKGMVWAEFG